MRSNERFHLRRGQQKFRGELVCLVFWIGSKVGPVRNLLYTARQTVRVLVKQVMSNFMGRGEALTALLADVSFDQNAAASSR